MFATLAVVVLCATPTPSSTPLVAKMKLAMGTFRFVGLSAELQTFIPEHLAQSLQSRGVEVMSEQDIKQMLGRERQRELLGCNEESASCQAELMGALGAEGVVVGDVAQVGGLIQVNVKIVSGVTGKPLATFATRVERERDLLDAIDRAAIALAHALVPAHSATLALDDAPPVVTSAPAMGRRSWSAVPAIAGAVVTLAGGTLLVLAQLNHDALTRRDRTTPLTQETALLTANRGASFQTLGLIGVGVGGAALFAGALMFLLAAPEVDTIQPSIAFGPSGATVTVGGFFP